jgi:ABC-type uncharacterized transport system substrate-binding protein
MSMARTGPLAGALAVALLSGALATPAQAHPHVWITYETTVIYEKGTFVGVRHKWSFDEFYTAMAIEGLDKNKDGVYDRDELAELAKVNIDGLKDFSFFTFPALAGTEIKIGEARDYWLEHKDGVLSLVFTLPFASPVLEEAKGLTIAVHDPTYFIAFEPAKTDPAKLSEGAPARCKALVGTPGQQPGKGAGLDGQQSQLGAFSISVGKAIMVECNGP